MTLQRERYNVLIMFCLQLINFPFFKNFCSNACFKASNFYKSQLSTEPLWLREKGSMPRINFIEETKL